MTMQVREPVLPRIKHHSKTGYANVLSENYTVQLRWPKKIKGIKGAHLAILYRSTDHFTIKLNTKKYNPSLNIGIFLHIIVNLYRFPITRLKSGRYIHLKFLFLYHSKIPGRARDDSKRVDGMTEGQGSGQTCKSSC